MWSIVPIIEFGIAMYIAVSKLGLDRIEFFEIYSMLSLVVSLFLQLAITVFTRAAAALFICAGLLQYAADYYMEIPREPNYFLWPFIVLPVYSLIVLEKP